MAKVFGLKKGIPMEENPKLDQAIALIQQQLAHLTNMVDEIRIGMSGMSAKVADHDTRIAVIAERQQQLWDDMRRAETHTDYAVKEAHKNAIRTAKLAAIAGGGGIGGGTVVLIVAEIIKALTK